MTTLTVASGAEQQAADRRSLGPRWAEPRSSTPDSGHRGLRRLATDIDHGDCSTVSPKVKPPGRVAAVHRGLSIVAAVPVTSNVNPMCYRDHP